MLPHNNKQMNQQQQNQIRSEPPSFCACNLAPHLASSQPQIHIASSTMPCNNYGGSSTRIGTGYHQHQYHNYHQPQFYGAFGPSNGSQYATMGHNGLPWAANGFGGGGGVGGTNYFGGIRSYGTGSTANISTSTPSGQQQRVHTSTASPL